MEIRSSAWDRLHTSGNNLANPNRMAWSIGDWEIILGREQQPASPNSCHQMRIIKLFRKVWRHYVFRRVIRNDQAGSYRIKHITHNSLLVFTVKSNLDGLGSSLKFLTHNDRSFSLALTACNKESAIWVLRVSQEKFNWLRVLDVQSVIDQSKCSLLNMDTGKL